MPTRKRASTKPNRTLAAVHTVTRLLTSSYGPESALKLMLEAAIQAVSASGGSILLHDPRAKQLWFSLVLGGDNSSSHFAAGLRLYGVAIQDDEGIAGQVFQSLQPHIENKIQENAQHAKRIDEEFDFETRNMITVPLVYPGGEAFGVMQLVNKRDGDFTDEDLTVLDIVANISAMNVHNTNLGVEARRTKTLDYLGRIVHDVANKVSQLEGPVNQLKVAQNQTLTELKAPVKTHKEMRSRVDAVSAGIRDLRRYTDFMSGAVAGQPIAGNRVIDDLIPVTECQLLLLDPICANRGVGLVRDFHKQGTLVFPFDSFLIERAVYNLVNNALNATPPGGAITVGVYAEGKHAVLSVQDTGTGMQPNVLAKILNWTVGSNVSTGSGLSTSIVREVAEIHGGTLEGDSTPGHGTIFRMRLPLHFDGD